MRRYNRIMAKSGRPSPLPAESVDVNRVLAFINTLSSRPTETPVERLVSYDALVGSVRAACHSVDSNLAALKDSEYVERMRAERQQLEADSESDAERAREALG